VTDTGTTTATFEKPWDNVSLFGYVKDIDTTHSRNTAWSLALPVDVRRQNIQVTRTFDNSSSGDKMQRMELSVSTDDKFMCSFPHPPLPTWFLFAAIET